MTQPTEGVAARIDQNDNYQGNNQQAAIADLTDSSGGTTDGTVAAISGSGADADINNNFAELTAKVNALLANARLFGQIAD